MARESDRQKADRLKEINAELDGRTRRTQRYIELEKEAEQIEKELLKIEKERSAAIDAQTKARKGYVKLSQDAKKAEEAIDKSLTSRLTALIKGNVAGAIGLKTTRDHERAQKDLASDAKEMAKQALDHDKLNGKQKAGIVSLTQDIKDGLVDEEGIRAKLAELGMKDGDTTLKNALALNKTQGDVATKGKLASKNMARFAKLGAGAGVVLTALFSIAQKFAASVDSIGKQFGSLNVLSDEFKGNLMDAEMEVVGIGATMEDVVATTSALAGEFGISATDAADLSAQVIDTAKAVGLSNEEAAKLSGILQTTSGLSAEQAERLTEGAFQLAVANDVAPDAVMKDLASSAEEFASFSKDGGDNLARAAVQAKSMGLSLSDTAKIAEGLLNFQDSITKEVEASVLIGRQLNLQKAREAALADDLVGVNEAIAEQLGGQAEFNKLNSIQRKALADALNTDVANLAKMVANQEKANDLAGETAKSFEDIIGKEAMSELTATMNELKIFGVAVAQTLGPPLMAIAKLVNLFLVPLGNMVTGIASGLRGAFGGATMNDGVVGAGGISVMAGPAGVFKLNPRDNVLATTNPIPINDGLFGSTTSGGGGGTNVEVNSRIVPIGGGQLGVAIDAYTYPKKAQQSRTKFEAVRNY